MHGALPIKTPRKPASRRPAHPVRRSQPVVQAPAPPTESTIPTYDCELEAAEGLQGLAWSELKTRFGERIEKTSSPPKPGILTFRYTGNLYQLIRLQMAQAVYLSRRFAVPRPKALLGDQHFKALLAQIAAARELWPADAYKTLHISAAGSESSVMNRLKEELAAKTGLEVNDVEGDLLLRLRRPMDGSDGWEVLVRLSPRPLATRPWRVCNREGALNATVAHAMIRLTNPQSDDAFLNMLCGSGTLLIERLTFEPTANVIGFDHDPQALDCARKNIAAAGFAEQISLVQGDARHLELPDSSIDALVADLPFGNLVGSHEGNMIIYPALLDEAARVAKPGARAVIITHEIKLMDTLLANSQHWKTSQVIRITLGGLHPRIFVLERR